VLVVAIISALLVQVFSFLESVSEAVSDLGELFLFGLEKSHDPDFCKHQYSNFLGSRVLREADRLFIELRGEGRNH